MLGVLGLVGVLGGVGVERNKVLGEVYWDFRGLTCERRGCGCICVAMTTARSAPLERARRTALIPTIVPTPTPPRGSTQLDLMSCIAARLKGWW